MKYGLWVLSLFLGLMGCSADRSVQAPTPESDAAVITLYHNGPIITMSGETPLVQEALLEQAGKIVFVGSFAQAKAQLKAKAGKPAKEYDLQGSSLLPGFIEPHLHPSLAAVMLQNDIIAPYDWKLPSGVKPGVSGQANYRQRITQSIQDNAKADQMYFIWGYHQLWHGSLSRDLLNQIAGDKPVGIIHRSFHEIYLNDAAIDKLGIKQQDFANNPQVEWDKGHF